MYETEVIYDKLYKDLFLKSDKVNNISLACCHYYGLFLKFLWTSFRLSFQGCVMNFIGDITVVNLKGLHTLI